MRYVFISKEPWFRAKSYGLGAGLPTRPEGWALIAVYLLALAGIGQLSKSSADIARIAAFILVLSITAIFLATVHNRTEGGWKWRWGNKA